ncbi:hypothetical protein LRP49_12865 [Enterovibrio sp. ZSDZ35]|uniref:Lipopolysaccharide biosynthesis protein n=1 Tax=Enterovibrio qingdaonensis TaxID=2899818 RepID=A0ABT5QM43_9GAMM|nr:hypothetical protein [Enterovibrio sp. ZSDZ35]MDD1782063.1 hypothetical protein [Enterovibrio sp. ZSDZ35]
MQRILLLADNRTNLITPLLKQMAEMDLDTTYVDASDLCALKKYPTIFHRVKAKLVDELFFRRKRNWGRECYINKLCEEKFDHIIVLIPAMLTEPAFITLKSAFSEKFTCVFWDSLNKAPSGKTALKFCNNFFSFDKDDCNYPGVKYLPTFIQEDSENTKDDVFKPKRHFFGVFGIENEQDKRFQTIKDFAESNPNLIGLVYLVSEKLETKQYFINQTKIVQSNRRLIGDELQKQILDAQCILDIVDERQTGLSPRIGNAYQSKRKLITNNKTALESGWFSENTHVFTKECMNAPLEFVEKEYTLSKNPSCIPSWIDKVLNH